MYLWMHVCMYVCMYIPQRIVPMVYPLIPYQFIQIHRQLRKHHFELLKTYRHVRYMWLPHTDSIVVVVSNPYQEGVDPLPKYVWMDG